MSRRELTRRLEAPFSGDPWPVFRRVRTGDPALFAGFLDLVADRLGVSAPLALYAVFAGPLAGQPPARGDMAAGSTASGWQPWSRAAVQAHTAAGKPVFVDFTAAWCVTCQANKRMALNRDTVRQAFDRHGVVLLRADWTNRDDEITSELARFNRNGVPLYVLYDRSGTPQVLPELLTERIVLDALERL